MTAFTEPLTITRDQPTDVALDIGLHGKSTFKVLADGTLAAPLAGGAEIAYAEYTGGTILGPTAAATPFDIPGLSIPVPAGTGRHSIEAICNAQVNWLGTAVAADSATFRLVITDEGGLWVAQSMSKVPVIVSGGTTVTLVAKRPMPATAAGKTYKASLYIDSFTHVNNTVVFGSSGTGGSTSVWGIPAFIQAVAL